MNEHLEKARNAILSVGDGRGFVVEHDQKLLVLTAAHCLPQLPRTHPASYIDERTYSELLGNLSEPPRIAAECLFADPIADVAVLGPPDSQELEKEFDKYEEFLGSMAAIPIAEAKDDQPAFLLSLDGKWEKCEVMCLPRTLPISNPAHKVESGMSGSPIATEMGEAIGLVSTGDHFNPRLTQNLPKWVLVSSSASAS